MTTGAIISQILPGVLISVLLLAILLIQEFTLASRNPFWTRVRFFLIIPIVPLLALFLIQMIFGFDPLVTPDEFSEVFIPEINLSTVSVADLTPSPIPPGSGPTERPQPEVSKPTPSPSLTQIPIYTPIGTGIPGSADPIAGTNYHVYCPVAYRDYP